MLPFFVNPRKLEKVLFVIWSSLSIEMPLLAQLHEPLKKTDHASLFSLY